MKNITKIASALLLSFLLFMLFSAPVRAVYFESGNSITLPKDKKMDETVTIAGSSLTIDSDVNGDLLCAGKDVVVNGNVKGDILCAAQTVKINGNVDGDVRVAAQSIELNGLVTRNVYALSQSLTLAKFSAIKGDILFGVQNIDLRGALGRDMAGAGEQIRISGSLLRNAKVTGSKISLIDPAKVGGDFEYYMTDTGIASISQKNVKGRLVKHEIAQVERTNKEFKDISSAAMVTGKIFWIISNLLLGFALLYFFKESIQKRIQIISQKPVITGLTGFAFLVLTPLVVIILLVTMIGAPLAMVLLLEYIVAIMLASVAPAIMMGEWLIHLTTKKRSHSHTVPLLLGTAAIGLLYLVPFIGALAGFLILCIGLGATFRSYLPEK